MKNAPMDHIELSPAGEVRRSAMKSELQARMSRIHRSRRRRRTLAATGLAIALTVSLGLAGWRAMVSGTDPRESGARLAGSSSEQTDGCDGADPDVTIIRRGGAASSGIIELVETDRSAAERWRARSSDASPAVVVERIQDDSELIEVLAAADHPTGLIRMEGDVRFTNPKLN